MRKSKLLLLAAAFAIPAAIALAADAPHDASFTAASVVSGTCDACHQLHGSPGGTLSRWSTNDAACAACHTAAAAPGDKFGLPWSSSDAAIPGVSGIHHSWTGTALNATWGAKAPVSPMGDHLVSGKLQCSTCHDTHPSSKANFSARHVSLDTDTWLNPTTGSVTSQVMITVAAGTAANPKGYWLKAVQIVSGTSFKLLLCNDWGKAPANQTWLKWDGAAWVAATGDADTSGTAMTVTGSPSYALNDGANVSVKFQGTMVLGDEWKFYVSYPFLRVSNVADANGVCVACHGDRNMTHACVDGSTCTANGTTVFSHPVAEPVGGSGGTTPALAQILDVNGTTQVGGTDTNKTNDMFFDSSNRVGCLSCHAPHNADSNSLSVDKR